MLVAAVIISPVALTPETSSAEGLLDFFFGGQRQQQTPPSGDAFNANPQSPPPRPGRRKRGTCLLCAQLRRQIFSADARRGLAGADMPSFCPATPTKVFFGSSIDSATTTTGERYADSENAFAYRKALRADCTCNGHSPVGLAPVDLALDGSLRRGDAVATTDGLVAYSGIRLGNDQTPDFIPVVAPARADMTTSRARNSEAPRTPLPATRGRP